MASEEKLLENLDLVFNKLGDGLLFLDTKGKILKLNQAVLDLSGYKKEELIGSNVFKLTKIFPSKSLKKIILIFAEVLKGKSIDLYTIEVKTRQGELKIIEVNTSVLKQNNKVGMIVVVIRDITGRVNLEKELKESKEIIEESGIVTFVWLNKKGWPIKYVSNNVVDIFGYSVQDFKSGKISYEKVIHPKDLSRVFQEVKENSENLKVKSFKHQPYRIITKKEKIKVINDRTFIIRNKQGKVIEYRGLIEDITEKKKLEDDINNMFNLSNYMVCKADLKTGRFIKISSAFSKILGWSEEELLSKPFTDFIHPKDVKKTNNAINEQMKEGKEILKFENRYKTKKGDYVWLEWSAHPVPEENVSYSSAYDITYRKKTEKKLRENQEDSQRRNEELEKINNLMVGRELKMIELKKEIKKLKSGMASIEKKKTWTEKFQEAVELEEAVIRKYQTFYLDQLKKSNLSLLRKRKAVKLLNRLIDESVEHENRFRELIKKEYGKTK